MKHFKWLMAAAALMLLAGIGVACADDEGDDDLEAVTSPAVYPAGTSTLMVEDIPAEVEAVTDVELTIEDADFVMEGPVYIQPDAEVAVEIHNMDTVAYRLTIADEIPIRDIPQNAVTRIVFESPEDGQVMLELFPVAEDTVIAEFPLEVAPQETEE